MYSTIYGFSLSGFYSASTIAAITTKLLDAKSDLFIWIILSAAILTYCTKFYLDIKSRKKLNQDNYSYIETSISDRAPSLESFYHQHFANQDFPFYWIERIWKVFIRIMMPSTRPFDPLNPYEYNPNPYLITEGDFLRPEFTWDFGSHNPLSLELLDSLEREFAIQISGEEVKTLHNFKDLVNVIIPKLKPPLAILVTSTGNTCLSVMAAVLMNYLGKGRFRAFHAKSQITENINPFVFETLENNGVPDKGYGSKPWDESSNTPIDIVIALSDQVAGEVFPLPIKSASQAVWNVPNPSHITGSQDESLMLFRPLILICQSVSTPCWKCPSRPCNLTRLILP